MLGSGLAEHFPARLRIGDLSLDWSSTPLLTVFALSALLRLVVVATFLWGIREFRAVPPSRVRNVIYRLARFNSITGATFDLVDVVRRGNSSRANRDGNGSSRLE
jgi:hypothetical protein